MNIIKENRIGRFTVSLQAIRSEKFEILQEVFSKVIVVRAEASFSRNVMEYEAYSPVFEKVDRGDQMFEYQCEITKRPLGGFSVKWRKL